MGYIIVLNLALDVSMLVGVMQLGSVVQAWWNFLLENKQFRRQREQFVSFMDQSFPCLLKQDVLLFLCYPTQQHSWLFPHLCWSSATAFSSTAQWKFASNAQLFFYWHTLNKNRCFHGSNEIKQLIFLDELVSLLWLFFAARKSY